LISWAANTAKEKRDEFLRVMHLFYSNNVSGTNVGHPAPLHRQAIVEHDLRSIHASTFAQIKDFINLVGFVLVLQKFPTFINLVA
jgi:ribonuclease HII